MPTTIPGYHLCPRCNGRDIYFAKRTVGQIGNIIDLPNGVSNPAVGYNVERKVALCRECGERADWIPEKIEYTKEESASKTRKTSLTLMWISAFAFFGTSYFLYESAKIGGDLGFYILFPVYFLLMAFYHLYKVLKSNAELESK